MNDDDTVGIVDPESGKELGREQKGEICIKSVSTLIGYLNRPDATKEIVDSEGWLHTGDIGYFDEDGYFFVVDRLKEIIKVKGLQVSPAELDDVLLSHSAVEDAAVVGIPHPDSGQVPKAFVVLKPGQKENISAKEIVQYAAERTAPYKQLLGGIEFIDKIPKSASGKILRKLLVEKSKSKL